jgi:predicted ester cyclase
MSDNESVVRGFLGAIGHGCDVETAATYLDQEFDAHMAGMPDLHGVDAWKQMAASFQTAFPDLDLTITELAVAGDLVSAHWSWTATHAGDLMGIGATGNRIQAEGAGFYRVRGGKIVSEWMIEDMLSVMQQVGAVPSPA